MYCCHDDVWSGWLFGLLSLGFVDLDGRFFVVGFVRGFCKNLDRETRSVGWGTTTIILVVYLDRDTLGNIISKV